MASRARILPTLILGCGVLAACSAIGSPRTGDSQPPSPAGPPAPAAAIVGAWSIVGTEPRDVPWPAASSPAGSRAPGTPSIRFNADGSVELDNGCNIGSGTYVVAGSTLTVANLVTTLRGCEPAATAVEGRIGAVLSQPAEIELPPGSAASGDPAQPAALVLAGPSASLTLERSG